MCALQRTSLAVCILVFSGFGAWAAQTATTDPDGKVAFYASTTSVTRISIMGDRIRRIINDASQFEMSNDESTGDVFLRFSGEQATRESGFIVTEKGVTIGYDLRPANRPVEPVLISIRGQDSAASVPGQSNVALGGDDIGYSDSVAVEMTAIIRNVASAHVAGKTPTGRNNRVVKTVRGDGWKATVRVAAAGPEGRLVREQDFYRSGVKAIWVLRNQLAANERTFVVVVEAD